MAALLLTQQTSTMDKENLLVFGQIQNKYKKEHTMQLISRIDRKTLDLTRFNKIAADKEAFGLSRVHMY